MLVLFLFLFQPTKKTGISTIHGRNMTINGGQQQWGGIHTRSLSPERQYHGTEEGGGHPQGAMRPPWLGPSCEEEDGEGDQTAADAKRGRSKHVRTMMICCGCCCTFLLPWQCSYCTRVENEFFFFEFSGDVLTC